MTEKELKEIAVNNRRIGFLKTEYAELRCGSIIKGQEITGMPFVSGVSDRTLTFIEDIVDLELEIKELEAVNIRLIHRARRFIDSIPDIVIRQVLTLKYINNLEMSEIACEVGLTEKECIAIPIIFFRSLL